MGVRMIIINSLNNLHKYSEIINIHCQKNGKIWNHRYEYFATKFSISKFTYMIFFDENKKIMCSVEQRDSDIWQCDINAYPFIYDELRVKVYDIIAFLDTIVSYLKIKCIYGQLIYEDVPLYSDIRYEKGFTTWDRLGNPIIIKKNYESIFNELKQRISINNVDRIRKKYKKKFIIKNKDIEDQIEDLEIIEKNSWKGRLGQNMLAREKQFAYYSDLMLKEVIKFIGLYYDKVPVAYILLAYHKDILYLIKWSYDEAFKSYSPGRNLMLDVIQMMDKNTYRYIDLYGSPDSLKQLLETNRIKRYDFIYPANSAKSSVEAIREERMLHDQEIYINYINKKAIKNMYDK